jgi:hypothetical protein
MKASQRQRWRWGAGLWAPSTPLAPLAVRGALVSIGILGLVALSAACVRVLPWMLDSRVPWRVAVPFARAIASVAVEASVLVGWPVGWALAAFTLGERGEARVLATLGERPARTTAGLWRMALAFAAVLAAASLAGGRDASEPGRVVSALLGAGRASCGAGASAPSGARALDVPLVGAAWLCDSDGAGARLVGKAPFAIESSSSDALYTARAIDVAPDARRIELDDAWIASPAGSIHVKHAVFRLPPFVRASSLPAAWRALFLASTGALSAMFATWLLLAATDDERSASWRLHAIVLGAAGPVAALALLHVLEVAPAPMPLRLYALLPIVAVAATWIVSLALAQRVTSLASSLLARLPWVRAAATK